MSYVKPVEVISPKAHWSLIDVLFDRGKDDCAYALGLWDGEPRIGFRWNGNDANELGNPQSRGLPTWTMLDPEIHEQIIDLLPPDKLAMARGFLKVKLMLQGPTLQAQGDLVFYDLFQNPMVLVKLACKTVREIVQQPKISDAECQLLAMRHKSVVITVAGAMLEKGESTPHQNGRFKVIEIQSSQLRKVANQFSTDVLAMADAAHWG